MGLAGFANTVSVTVTGEGKVGYSLGTPLTLDLGRSPFQMPNSMVTPEMATDTLQCSFL